MTNRVCLSGWWEALFIFFVSFMLYALTDIVSLYLSVCRAIAWLTEGGYDNNCLQCQSNIQPNMPKGGGEKSIRTLILWCWFCNVFYNTYGSSYPPKHTSHSTTRSWKPFVAMRHFADFGGQIQSIQIRVASRGGLVKGWNNCAKNGCITKWIGIVEIAVLSV